MADNWKPLSRRRATRQPHRDTGALIHSIPPPDLTFAEAVESLKEEIFRGISEALMRSLKTEDPVEQIAIADIIAHRDDDTPRLMFADWLDDKGQPERGELIRVQCELARFPNQVEWLRQMPLEQWRGSDGEKVLLLRLDTLLKRERVLERLDFTREEAVFGDNLSRERRWSFTRGFVADITCTAEDWLTHADEITKAHPLERVTLTTWPKAEASGNSHHTGRQLWRLRGRKEQRFSPAPIIDLLAAEWPQIEFTLPPLPIERVGETETDLG